MSTPNTSHIRGTAREKTESARRAEEFPEETDERLMGVLVPLVRATVQAHPGADRDCRVEELREWLERWDR